MPPCGGLHFTLTLLHHANPKTFEDSVEFLQGIDLNYILSTYGYVGILVLTFLEGETIVILAGVAAYKGLMDPQIVALCAFTGTFLSDQTMFSLGKYKGPAVLKRFPRINAKVERASRLIKQYDTLLILGFRFVYGVRNVTPVLLGVSGVSHPKFFGLNFIGAGVWAVSFTAGGYYGAEMFERAIGKFGHAVFYVLLAVAVFGLVIWSIRYTKNKAGLEALAQKGRTSMARHKTDDGDLAGRAQTGIGECTASMGNSAVVDAPSVEGAALCPQNTPPATKEQ